MTTMEAQFRKWKAQADYINGEFPFLKAGEPVQEYKNAEGRLHRDDGPAYLSAIRVSHWQNGRRHGIDANIFGAMDYYYEGRLVPRRYIVDPESLTLEEVIKEKNTEVRYCGMKCIGYEKLIASEHVKEIDSQENPERTLFQVNGITREPFCLVRVLNGTPELDGSYKPYYLTVPGGMKTCQEAVAWTFKKTAETYKPLQET